MDHYLNQAEYLRWMRHYQISLDNYLARIANIHQILDNAPEDAIFAYPGLKEQIERALDEIEAKLEDAVPRDFSENREPLQGTELFTENMKILVDLIFKVFKKPMPFKSIYEQEKDRVQTVHQSFKFREKLIEVQNMVDQLTRLKQSEDATRSVRENILL